MELHQVESQKALGFDEIKSIKQGIVYFVSTGRNAWNNTWVARYSKGCMHSTFESAKSYAEKNRTSGTVFYIVELPCIVFRSKNNILLITQINNDSPLSGYSPDAVSFTAERNAKKIKGALENYIKIGAPLVGAGLSFLSTSRFWREKPQSNQAIMLLSHSNRSLPIETKGFNSLKTYSSSSMGSKYYLHWFSRESEIKTSAIISIVKSHKIKATDAPTQLYSTSSQYEKESSVHMNSSSVGATDNCETKGTTCALARLREMSVSNGDKGSPASRERAITLFLDEMREVVSVKVIDRLSDSQLRLQYGKWLEAVIEGHKVEERIDWLASCFTLFPQNLELEA
ncbi:MAG: hypothetical protein COA41_20085 [Sphingopyxis sp.]|nr:MAG: hypothetical protein COA41_20085 [Sphingopyxis sp.]